ncbi:MAG TPA: M1 family aminopeptidase [Flavobacterium sp.]|jgi:ABC-type transport system involved in multi-copper enzyme maturation permease subunit
MILYEIFRSEFGYLAGRVSTRLYAVVLLAFTIGMRLLVSTGDGVYPNNTLHITGMIVIGGLIWVVIGASVAGEAAARDVQVRIHPLIYTTPVTKLNYLGGRFMAAYALNALIILALPIGVLLSFYLPGLEYLTGKEHEELLPFRPVAYLNVYFLIALPTVFVVTAFQFTFAALSRQVMASYIASLILAIFAQIVAVTAAKTFGNWDLAKLLDPVGPSGILTSELGTWTVTEKNTRLIALEGMFLLNRILWPGFAAGLLLFTYRRFDFTNTATTGWLNRLKLAKIQADTFADSQIIREAGISVPQVQRNFGLTTNFHQIIRIAGTSFKKIAKHPIGLTLVGAVALISAAFGNLIINVLGMPLLPTTQQVVAYLAAPVTNVGSLWVIIPLLIMFFVGELVWRERDAGLGEIADAAPASDWVIIIGKFLGLGLIIVTWMGLLMAGGILMQLYPGYDKVEIGLYLQSLFGLQLIDYLIFTWLVFVVHIIANQKYIGYLLVIVIYSFMAFPSKFGVEHNMAVFGADAGWWYTDMRGFGPTPGPWLLFKGYWIGWCLLLAVAAKLLWVRGREYGIKDRLRLAKLRFDRPTAWLTISGAILIISLGCLIFYNTNVLNHYMTASDITARRANYEKQYGRYRNTPQPHLIATKLHVELFADRQQADIRAVYTFVNKDTVAIDSIHAGNASGIDFTEVNFDVPALRVLKDKELIHQIFALKKPLQPGDTLKMNFMVHYKQQGFEHNGTKALVVDNGTYFTNFDLLPGIGYQHYREIKDAPSRIKYGLPPRPEIPLLYDKTIIKKAFSTDQTTLEAIIGTAKDEVAVAPGALKRTWIKGDRRYFEYKTDGQIGGEYSILSAGYLVQERKWNDIDIRIYYHPDHAQNINRMLQSAEASLAYYTEHFGPYPFGYITLVERAGDGGGANADGGIIYYGEQYALMNPDDSPNGFDLPYYVMAHEVAHQWWGMARLTPANVEGAGVLIEGLAVYSGMQVLEKNYGAGHLQKYVNYLHSSYQTPRSLASASLLRANEPFLYYKKGGLAMYALSKYIGKKKINGALRNLIEKRHTGEIPLPTTLDLFRELKKVTPDSLDYLLVDLFKTNSYWRLKTKQFSADQIKTGEWQVTMKVYVQKVVIDDSGREKEMPMNDWLEIGIYEQGKDLNEPLYLKMHRFRSGEQTIQIIVPRKPDSGGIDPNYLMIDLRLEDNILQWDKKE